MYSCSLAFYSLLDGGAPFVCFFKFDAFACPYKCGEIGSLRLHQVAKSFGVAVSFPLCFHLSMDYVGKIL